MENSDKKKRLLTIIGVFILLVSIVGFTYAYFNSTVSSTGANIAGTTNADFASNLNITVTRINKTPTSASSINLVPSNITADTTSITRAISHNCEADGYTGCHLYQITATTNSAIAHANIYLDSLTVSGAAQDKNSWKYAVFTGTPTSATNVVTSGSFEVTTPGVIDIHNNASLASTVTYYLLIYITNDTANSQNSSYIYDVTGVYNGTVSMSAAGGKVSALFKSNESGNNNNNNNQQNISEGVYMVTDQYIYEGVNTDSYGDNYGGGDFSSLTYYNHNTVINGKNAIELAMAQWADITEIPNDTGPIFLRFTLGTGTTTGELNVPVEGYVGFVVDKEALKEQNCTANDSACETKYDNMVDGTYYLRGWVDESAENAEDRTVYNTNVNTIKTAIGYNNGNSSYCHDYYSYFYCNFDGLYVNAHDNGYVHANDGSHYCYVWDGGTAIC